MTNNSLPDSLPRIAAQAMRTDMSAATDDHSMGMDDHSLHQALVQMVGAAHVLTGEAAAPFLTDWRGRYTGAARAVVLPADVAEVAALVAFCARTGLPIVPQGGNTGLCGGATPDASGSAVLLCLRRMAAVLEVDTDNDTITVQAGCTLQAVQEAADDADRLFPLTLGAQGTCTIGGNLATNAGGTQVLRYGTMRELALGLEVVTADGQIWHGLQGLRKDNTGYALRDLYIGSEGTLGIITAATLKLFPRAKAQCTAMLALSSIEDAARMLNLARAGFGASLTAFELISDVCMQGVNEAFPEQRPVFDGDAARAPWFALLELSDSESESHARERFEVVLGAALQAGVAQDVVIAESVAQSRALWTVRERIPLAEAAQGKAIKHDISVPVSRMAEFVATTNAALQQHFPGVRHVIFGHLGDGNLHYNVARGTEYDEAGLLALQPEVYALVHSSVIAHRGSISAEHGVGQLKRDELPRYKDPVALLLMRQIKQALDPKGVLNPGKVLGDPGAASVLSSFVKVEEHHASPHPDR